MSKGLYLRIIGYSSDRFSESTVLLDSAGPGLFM